MINWDTSDGFRQLLADDLKKWKATQDWEDFSSLREIYRQLCFQVIAKKSGNYLQVALDYFIPLCDTHISERTYFPVDLERTLITFLYKRECLSFITEQPGGDAALAWFACYIGATNVNSRHYYSEAERATHGLFRCFLEEWSGKNIPFCDVPDFEIVVKHIFGEVCWDLYGCETPTPSNAESRYVTMHSILEAGAPLVFRPNTLSNPRVIPNDIFA